MKWFLLICASNGFMMFTVSCIKWIDTGETKNTLFYFLIFAVCSGFYKVIDLLEDIIKKEK